MTLLERLAQIRAMEANKVAIKESKKENSTPINAKVNEILENGICISYKEAGVLGLMVGNKKNWHEGIKFLKSVGLGDDAQLIIMKDGAQPNTKNKARMEKFDHKTEGYTEVSAEELIQLLDVKEAPKAPAKKTAKDKDAALTEMIGNLELSKADKKRLATLLA